MNKAKSNYHWDRQEHQDRHIHHHHHPVSGHQGRSLHWPSSPIIATINNSSPSRSCWWQLQLQGRCHWMKDGAPVGFFEGKYELAGKVILCICICICVCIWYNIQSVWGEISALSEKVINCIFVKTGWTNLLLLEPTQYTFVFIYNCGVGDFFEESRKRASHLEYSTAVAFFQINFPNRFHSLKTTLQNPWKRRRHCKKLILISLSSKNQTSLENKGDAGEINQLTSSK